MPKVDDRLLGYAKQLRREMTPAEAKLWFHLRAKRLNGVKFVRQSVRRPFIADFIARTHSLVIEVDGDTHGATSEYDQRRTRWLEVNGFRVLRFGNADVMENEEGVLLMILEALRPAPLPSAACGGSLPLPGGERDKAA